MRSSSSPAFVFILTLLSLLNLALAAETRPTGSSNDLPAYKNDNQQRQQQQILQNPNANPPSQGRDESNPPAHTPVATAAPDQDDVLASKGYWQNTFYKCKTDDGGEERCGWHTPILKAQARRELSMGVVIPAVMGAAGVFAWGLL